jgi:type II secretory pathway component PulM
LDVVTRMFERLREFWERMGPRERRLASLAGFVVVGVAVLYVAFMIQDGLAAIERRNDDLRAVLTSLANRHDELVEARSKQGETVAMIGEEAQSLAPYVEKIGGEVGVQIRAQAEKPTVAKGKFHEHATQLTLYDITLDQLARFLKGIETQSPTVVVQQLKVRRSTLQKEKLDRVEMVVATYSRAPARRPAGAAPATPAEGGDAP